MKSCPSCNRTFEDTFSFCLVDGAILSAPFDPLATSANAVPRDTGGARTEVLPSPTLPGDQPFPPTIPSPHPSSQETLFAQSTPPPASLHSAESYPNPRWSTANPESPASGERPGARRGLQLVIGLVVVGVLCLLFSATSIARTPFALVFRFVSSLSGVVFAVLFKRGVVGGVVGAILSLLVGTISGILLIGMFRTFNLSAYNLRLPASYAAYAFIGWLVTRLIGVVLRRIGSAS